VKRFYSEDNSCNIENLLTYLKNIKMDKIDRPKIPVALKFANSRVQKLLEERELSKEDFLKKYDNNEELYNIIHNSKVGNIEITKISDNPGYLSVNDTVSGFTAGFGEGMSCFIDCISSYYYTSTVQKIDWENKIFYTLNSKYSFKFNEFNSQDKET